MCGIIAGTDRKVTDAYLAESLVRLSRRGPDYSNFIRLNDSFLGFTLLGLASLNNETLHQPHYNHDKSIITCINGEIYNHAELRTMLQRRGYVFVSESDCEVVVHGLDCYGSDFISHLDGEFVIVAYFKSTRRWLCATDATGTKPLKYTLSKNSFKVASSVAALKSLNVPITLDIDNVLFTFNNLCSPITKTLFTGIQTIPPGYILEVDSQFTPTLYSYTKISHPGDIDVLLSDAISKRVPKFPLALTLSGGIDSCIIALYLKKLQHTFTCYTVDFVGSKFSELVDVERFCSRHSLRTKVVTITPDDLRSNFCESVINAEHLVINPHSAAKLLINKEMNADGFRVCMTGDGADELFYGYSHFHTSDEYQFLRDSTMIGAQYTQLLKPELRGRLLSSNLFDDYSCFNSDPSVQELYYSYWLNEYGLKILSDSQSMSQSIEYRYPFVDSNLMGFHSSREENTPSKQILRNLVSHYDPELSLIPKRAFTAPYIDSRWSNMFEEFVYEEPAIRNIFEVDKLRAYIGSVKASTVLKTQILSLGIIHKEFT
jgi:asparagine synthase (glutamine-hydrolysing)